MKASKMAYVVYWNWADEWDSCNVIDKVFTTKEDAQAFIDKKTISKKDMRYMMVSCPLFEDQKEVVQ